MVIFLIATMAGINGGSWPVWLCCLLVCLGHIAFVAWSQGSVLIGVQTSVQTVILDGVRTQRKAQKVQQLIAQRVESVQGPLSEAELQSALFKDAPRADTKPEIGVPPVPTAPVPPLPVHGQKEGPSA